MRGHQNVFKKISRICHLNKTEEKDTFVRPSRTCLLGSMIPKIDVSKII